MKSYDELIDDLLELSFAEDIGDGDHTTLCCIPENEMGKSQLIIKEEGILAGVEIMKVDYLQEETGVGVATGSTTPMNTTNNEEVE